MTSKALFDAKFKILISFLVCNFFCGCKLHKTTQFKVVRAYRVFIRENSHRDKVMLNLKISTDDDIYCKVKKFGVVLYQVQLKRKSYLFSEVYKFSHIAYDDLLKFLCDDNGVMDLRIDDFEVSIDNQAKIVKAEKIIRLPMY